jgi:hypothetical protein
LANKKVNVEFKDGKFIADPPVVRLKFNHKTGGDELTLSNRTDEDVIWNLEDPTAFGAPILEVVKSRKKSTPRTARNVKGEFHYQVLMIKSGRKAKGNSDPVIIIEN